MSVLPKAASSRSVSSTHGKACAIQVWGGVEVSEGTQSGYNNALTCMSVIDRSTTPR